MAADDRGGAADHRDGAAEPRCTVRASSPRPGGPPSPVAASPPWASAMGSRHGSAPIRPPLSGNASPCPDRGGGGGTDLCAGGDPAVPLRERGHLAVPGVRRAARGGAASGRVLL